MLDIVYSFLLVLFAVLVNTELSNTNETWEGKWFPQNPLTKQKNDLKELFDSKTTKIDNFDSWKWNWFPYKPTPKHSNNTREYGIHVDSVCDDGKTNIGIDFDPENVQQNFRFLCLDTKSKYDPNYATSPIQKEYIVPPAYKAPSICQSEPIDYTERLPTFGSHRYLYPKYGEYKFLPTQRWIHNLEYGAIVMLYHPCANSMQIQKLRGILNACLYRHIITPSTALLPERPLALLAWGKSLEMSVVDVSSAVNFIKRNAQKGSQNIDLFNEKYSAGLQTEAKLVTDESDFEICANINM